MSMTLTYRQITPDLARRIRLVMTDVDGTLTSDGRSFGPEVLEAIHQLERQDIMVGLASGRTLSRLESLSYDLGISGPLIGENGGVAKLKADGEPVDLGYFRQPAIEAFKKLKKLFPGITEETEYNKDRFIDFVIKAYEVEPTELSRHLEDAQLLDSGYMLHLLQKGVSKGRTLMRLLKKIGDESLSPAEVMVFGDSLTDISLFQLLPYGVFIPNPVLSAEHSQALQEVAKYESNLPFGRGFAEVAFHILNARLDSDLKK